MCVFKGWAYDGSLIKAVNVDAEVILERNILGRVVKETCNGETVESIYDKAGNRTNIKSSLGADIQAEYNLMGDVVSLANGGWKTQYQRDVFGLETERTLNSGLKTRTTRDKLGRVTGHKIENKNKKLSEKEYLWGTNDKLLSVVTNGKAKNFTYDGWGNLSKTVFEDGKTELRNPDKVGNLFESLDRMDRKYSAGGQLIKTERWEYKYDTEGNLIRKKDKHGATWRYEWNDAGMLVKVKRPDAVEVTFKYDALGRRIEKSFNNRTFTKWVWDGNVPLHEWKEIHTPDYSEEKGYFTNIQKQPVVTWVFEEGTFVPTAKLTKQKEFSIVTNYLGTPESMFSSEGENVWSCELNSYGKVRIFEGQSKVDCPFRYQGQYEDSETGLFYNRFRYYSPDEGIYISQDPIRLNGGVTLYSYVHNPNGWVDKFGLESCDETEEDKLDWSRSRNDGETTEDHVRRHETDDKSKQKHGVFNGDAVDITNDAWEKVQTEGITPTPSGSRDVYNVPYPNAGTSGGSLGDGSTIDNVTIVTERDSNVLVTSYPKKI